VSQAAKTLEASIVACRVQYRSFRGHGLINKLRWLKEPPLDNVVTNPSKYHPRTVDQVPRAWEARASWVSRFGANQGSTRPHAETTKIPPLLNLRPAGLANRFSPI
jgi:hypothetical protein